MSNQTGFVFLAGPPIYAIVPAADTVTGQPDSHSPPTAAGASGSVIGSPDSSRRRALNECAASPFGRMNSR